MEVYNTCIYKCMFVPDRQEDPGSGPKWTPQRWHRYWRVGKACHAEPGGSGGDVSQPSAQETAEGAASEQPKAAETDC